MNEVRFALNNIKSRPFRSGLAFLFVAMVVIAAFWTTLVLETVRENLESSLQAMESMVADIVVVPRSSSPAYLQPGNLDLKRLLTEIVAIPGVESISPQVRLFTANNSRYSSQPVLYVTAIDLASDFTVQPWLVKSDEQTLKLGEAYGGSTIDFPAGQANIIIAGNELILVDQLAETGTILDQTIYVSYETARVLSESFKAQKVSEAGLEANYVPVIMVNASPGSSVQKVSNQILGDVQGVTSFEAANFFQSGREQMSTLLNRLPLIFAMTLLVGTLCIGLIFTITVNERKQEWGVLRVLGSTRQFLLSHILREGQLIALAGGIFGFLVSLFIGNFFINQIAQRVNLPLGNPPLQIYVGLFILSLLIALLSVTLASLYPVWLVNRQDPAVVLRG